MHCSIQRVFRCNFFFAAAVGMPRDEIGMRIVGDPFRQGTANADLIPTYFIYTRRPSFSTALSSNKMHAAQKVLKPGVRPHPVELRKNLYPRHPGAAFLIALVQVFERVSSVSQRLIDKGQHE